MSSIWPQSFGIGGTPSQSGAGWMGSSEAMFSKFLLVLDSSITQRAHTVNSFGTIVFKDTNVECLKE